MAAYYNEIDPKAAAWLRELIRTGEIADGEVDERSIELVRPDDLRGFVQCHFFAGIGGWPLALRWAGWPDGRAVWTGSCPCQPFSAAGKGDGFADERHLWPAWHWLIAQRRPVCLFGEQVESPSGRAWFDLVSTDLEAYDYACWSSDLPVAGVGAPGIRQRLFWVADRYGAGQRIVWREQLSSHGDASQRHDADGCVAPVRLADRRGGQCAAGRVQDDVTENEESSRLAVAGLVVTGRLVDRLVTRLEGHAGDGGHGYESRRLDADAARSVAATGATRGPWGDADWLYCRDEKFRPVEPGTQQMANGLSRAVGLLRDNSALKEKVDAATSKGFRAEVVRAMRSGVRSETVWHSTGRRLGFPAAFLLLASVCEQPGQLGQFVDGAPQGCAENGESQVRAVSAHGSIACPPQGWELPEQLARELGDLVPELSQVGAQLSGMNGFPLADGIPARVGRLRGYGNAINPYVAAAFIESYLAIEG